MLGVFGSLIKYYYKYNVWPILALVTEQICNMKILVIIDSIFNSLCIKQTLVYSLHTLPAILPGFIYLRHLLSFILRVSLTISILLRPNLRRKTNGFDSFHDIQVFRIGPQVANFVPSYKMR